MAYTVDQDISNPTLEEMTRAAIEVLSRNPEGYFLYVEGESNDSFSSKSKIRKSAVTESHIIFKSN